MTPNVIYSKVLKVTSKTRIQETRQIWHPIAVKLSEGSMDSSKITLFSAKCCIPA